MSVANLLRPEIRDLEVYQAASQADGALRLHANEVSWPGNPGANGLNRYPEIRPLRLQSRLAERFAVSPDNLLVTRGSSEAIDLLIRAFCIAGKDNIVIAPPTFGMYRVYAAIQGAGVIVCPLLADRDFAFDAESVLAGCTDSSKLVFVCTPNNPTGNLVPRADILRLLEARRDRSVIVVDEAYIEFSGDESMAGRVGEYENLVVLRTLSKALALAGARCGALIGSSSVIRTLSGVLAPYALATPVVERVLEALSPEPGAAAARRVREIVAERDRIADRLSSCARVERLWPSRTNFLLVRFRDLAEVQNRLRAERILIRDLNGTPGLENCARITVGTPDDNDRLLAVLNGGGK